MKYLICNLKANKTYPEIIKYRNFIETLDLSHVKFMVSPPTIYLPLFKGMPYPLVAQYISKYNEPFTGEIMPSQLQSVGVKYIIIGHFEQRKYYKEDEIDILTKIKKALKNNFKVIYCIGESYEEYNRKVSLQVLERLIARIYNNLSSEDIKNIIIAYEPTWLIGSIGINIDHIESIITFIKHLISNYYHVDSEVIYGGNVTSDNITKLNAIKDLDGFIIGRAILDEESLKNIINLLEVNP